MRKSHFFEVPENTLFFKIFEFFCPAASFFSGGVIFFGGHFSDPEFRNSSFSRILPDLRFQTSDPKSQTSPDLPKSRQTSSNLSPDLRSQIPDLARPPQTSRQISDPRPTNISVLLAIHRPDICWLVLAVGSLRPPYLGR